MRRRRRAPDPQKRLVQNFLAPDVKLSNITPMAIAVQAPPADETLSDNLCWLLARASHSLTMQLTTALADLGVSPRAHCVLSTALTGEFTQTALVVTLDELEAAGLAERRPAAGDRRARIVAVTKAGERKVARARQIVDGALVRVTSRIGSVEVEVASSEDLMPGVV